MTPDPTLSGRATCYACFAPEQLCYCKHIVRIKNRTRIVIAQHPKEEFHPLNTARIVERSLMNGARVVAHTDRLGAELARAGVCRDTAVLYPSADAELLSDMPVEARPKQVLVLDGTWHHAKTLLRDVPLIQNLRRVRFVRAQPSEYRIRKEPKQEYLSTLESVHHVLGCLEPETAQLDGLLDSFRAMIALNMEARRPEGRSIRHVNRSRKRSHRFPKAFLQDPAHFVSVYCEGTTRFSTRQNPESIRQVLYLGLERPFENGEAFQRVLRTCQLPAAQLRKQLELDDHFLERATPPEQALAEVESALSAKDVICVWNQSSAEMLRELGVKNNNIIMLKGSYCDWVRYLHFRDEPEPLSQSTGGLDEIIARHRISVRQPVGSGRGARRLSQTSALLRWLYSAYQQHGSLWD